MLLSDTACLTRRTCHDLELQGWLPPLINNYFDFAHNSLTSEARRRNSHGRSRLPQQLALRQACLSAFGSVDKHDSGSESRG